MGNAIRTVGAVGLLILLGACQTIQPPGTRPLGMIGQGAAVMPQSVPPCYRTLAKVDCHTAPLAGAESRRVGYFHFDAQD